MKVLFVCTLNSCRSQMAEGFLRHYGQITDQHKISLQVYSAGTNPSYVNPLAIKAMKEIGIDISKHRSKNVLEIINQDFDYIITVCDKAKEACPNFPGKSIKLHWSFEDPAEVQGNEETKMKTFKKVRDQIKEKIIDFLQNNTLLSG